ncbi:helix-turn-helix domain-containing protein [Kribbella sp. NPDC051770]|uniref:ArsR/SmtB family transcription factor n=1 Tax=Kribbella sp. NPDC051770 TaxID=3155413 RepID=UPI003415CA7C
MDEDLEISSAAQFKALGHPLRHRLLFALGQESATTSQLAVTLGTGKGNIAHHLGVLREAGMVEVTETRQVRGGTEQYYRRTAHRFSFTGEGARENNTIALQAVAADLQTADDPLLNIRNVRLTQAQAEELAAQLDKITTTLKDAGPGEARHGVVVAVYRPEQT